MTVFRVVKSLILVETGPEIYRMIMTLSCDHQISFPKDWFSNRKPIPRNRSGQQIYRCSRCEEIYTRQPDTPDDGGAA